jgi:hypothetical protein
MKLKIKGVYLTDIDIRLMRYLHAVKVATYEQIGRDIYPGYHPDSVGKRLRKLEDNRFISMQSNRPDLNCKRVVSLT